MSSLRLHAFEPRSRANGPGVRAVIWAQGCDLGCRGCFNPATHTDAGGDLVTPSALLGRITALGDDIEGITISGGEPLQQPAPLLAFLELLRQNTSLSVLVFSGYTLPEIRTQPHGPDILAHIDVLIDGRYDPHVRLGRNLRGSANQSIHCLTDRYTVADVEATPDAEVRIDPAGNLIVTGIAGDRIPPKNSRDPKGLQPKVAKNKLGHLP